MAFSDPQTVTIAGTASSLARISTGENTSTYATADGAVKLRISHTYGRRNRRLVRLDVTKVAADPFMTGVNQEYSESIQLVIDSPKVGFTNTEIKDAVVALAGFLTASTNAATVKIVGGES